MAPGSKTSDAPFGNRQSSVKAPSERVYAQKVLRLWLCGRLAGELDGEPVSMPSSGRARALIGWLALHPGPHPRADVATRLWPETSEARANLRTAIWAVRQAWGAAGVHLDGQRNFIGLMPSEVWVDAITDPPVGEPLPEGELIPELDDDWLDVEREQYRRRQLTRLAGLARNAEAAGENLDAARWAAERCRLAPLDESAHRELLRLMGTNGTSPGRFSKAAVLLNGCAQNWGSIPPRPPGRHRRLCRRQPPNPAGRRCLAGPRSCALCSTPGARRPGVAVRSSC